MIATVIGIDDVIAVTPTLDTNVYASGDQLGGIQTITDAYRTVYRPFDQPSQPLTGQTQLGGKAILQSITIIDGAKQSQPIDIMFFSSSPTLTSSDNAAIDISDAEMAAKCIGVVSVDTAYVDLSNNSLVTYVNAGLVLKQDASATDHNIYAVCIIRGAATYAADSLKFLYGFMQD
jgi:hypothetical protein